MSNWDFNTVFNRHFDVNGIRDAMQQRFKMLERKFNEEMAAKRQQVDNELAALRKETEKVIIPIYHLTCKGTFTTKERA